MPVVICRDNWHEAQDLFNAYDLLVSFNGIKFDNSLLAVNEVFLDHAKCYDILREAWIHDDLDPDNFDYKTHGGYGLDAFTQANFGIGKSGDGGMAPVEWQLGRIGKVITYCLRDVWLTKMLFDRIIAGKPLKHPKFPEKKMKLAYPKDFWEDDIRREIGRASCRERV